MFDFGFSELLLVGVIALIVLGPERLPKVARTAGQIIGKMQRLVANVKQELSTQVELEELRQAKQQLESAAKQLRHDIKEVGSEAQSSLEQISDGLKPWERLPEQRTPADFGIDGQGRLSEESTAGPVGKFAPPTERLDENGQPIAPLSPVTTETTPATESVQDQQWRQYLTAAKPPETPTVTYVETVPASINRVECHITTLRKQAMQRKRDMRPRFQAKPKLRVRKK